MTNLKITSRGWIVLYCLVAILIIAFLIWSDTTWVPPIPLDKEF